VFTAFIMNIRITQRLESVSAIERWHMTAEDRLKKLGGGGDTLRYTV